MIGGAATSYDRLAPEPARQVDEACDRFESAWQAGGRPAVESHVAAALDEIRSILRCELILLDIAYRRRAGDAPAAEDYREQFPTLSDEWLDRALASRPESTVATMPANRPTPAGPVPVIPGYEIVRELGRGGMGVVYLGRDVRLDRPVALKFLSAEAARDPRRLDRFRREARAAGALNHPAVCTLYDVGEAAGSPYLVLEHVEGKTFRTLIRDRPAVNQTLPLIRQVAEALRVAHAAGIVHRDIKPENLMVRPDGYVKVLDFGLARLQSAPGVTAEVKSEADTDPGMLVGTACYMAPEQARAEVTESPADVFALGIIIYELVTGRHPFPAATEFDRLHAITSLPPIAPASRNPSVSVALEALILRMLEKDPRLRPTAAEATAALDDLTVTGGRPAPAPPPGGRRVVGREVERDLLWTAFEDATTGRGRLVCVTGEPGIGKTTLVEDFFRDLTDRGRPHCTARGRCSERLAGAEAYLPVFEALDGLLRGNSGEVAARALAAVAPAWLAQVVPQAAGEAAPQPASQERLKREFVAFAREVSRWRPVVLFFDDVHWADASTLDLIAYLGGRCDGLNVLTVLTYRPTEMLLGRHPFLAVQLELQRRAVGQEIRLGLLGRAEVDQYLCLAFPEHQFPEEFIALVHSRTDGNPLFVVDLVRYLGDRGLIACGIDGWALTQPVPDVEGGLPESVRSMIRRKLGLLNEDDRQLLSVAGVRGPEFDSAGVAEVLGWEPADVEERLQVLDQVHGLVRLVREVEFPDRTLALRYAFVHHLYQQSLYVALAPSRRAAWSVAHARALLRFHGAGNAAVAAEVACLFEAARQPAEAARHFLLAAQNAARIYAHQEAVALARRGLRLLGTVPDTPDRARCELALQMTLGMQLQVSQGYAVPEAARIYARAHALLDQVEDAPPLFSVLWGLWIYFEVYGEPRKSMELAERLFSLAQSAKDPAQLLQSRQALTITSLCLGNPTAARDHMEQGIVLYDPRRHSRNTDLYGQDPLVGCLAFGAVALWLLGYPDQAAQRNREAIALSEELGQPSTLALAHYFTCMLRQYRREGPAVLQSAEVTTAIAIEHGFAFWLANGQIMSGWALADRGEWSDGITRLHQGLAAFVATGAGTYRSYTLSLLAEALGKVGQFEEGLSVLADAIIPMDRAGETFHGAELYRLRGELLIQSAPDDITLDEPEACFHRALAIARGQRAKSLELRAAMSLTRLYQKQGRHAEARPLLTECYEWFTEGLDTADLKEAKAILEQVS